MAFFCRFRFHLLAKCFQRGVHEKADVAHAQLSDFADFPVAEAVLEFEPDTAA